eukprot:gb/GEZN01005110.1/.p1 GENE.gb/GEZN01005110.1/~~gb/GEZN01005110.1/.p1  ORF type:complete len:551 (-),score=56.57 gb/GEZN01005110.1/:124-1776(-)
MSFHSSTQKNYWLFESQSEVDAERRDAFQRSLETLHGSQGETPTRKSFNHSVNSTLDHDIGKAVLSPMPSLPTSTFTSPSLQSFPSSLASHLPVGLPYHSRNLSGSNSSSHHSRNGSTGSVLSLPGLPQPSPWASAASSKRSKPSHSVIFSSPELAREDEMRMSISPHIPDGPSAVSAPPGGGGSQPSYLQPIPTPASSPAQRKINPQDILTLAQRTALLRHIEGLVFEIAKCYDPPLPLALQATAITFFKRYYLRASIRTHHPCKILLTCVYLAKKVEEFAIELLGLVKTPCMSKFWEPHELDDEEKEKTVVGLEVPVLEGLCFHLRCFHPFKPLTGLLLAMDPPLSTEERTVVEDKAKQFLLTSLFTDASLLYAPSQLAMAALIQSLKDGGWDRSKLDGAITNFATLAKLPEAEIPKLKVKTGEIAKCFITLPRPTGSDLSELWRKFACTRDLRYVKGSEEWNLAEKRKEHLSDTKRSMKLDNAKRIRSDDNSLLSEPLVRESPEEASPGFTIRRRSQVGQTPTPVHIRSRPTPPHPFADTIPEMSPF